MPLIEYHCKNCAESFEDLQLTAQDADNLTCPHCASDKLERKLSLFTSAIKNSAPACADGSCSLPPSGCANGVCNLA